MSDYDAADSQIKTGVMAREAADDLSCAMTWLNLALENAYDDQEEIEAIISQLKEMYDRYHSIGEAL